MDTARLKRFATDARKTLMQGVIRRIQSVGFDIESGMPSGMPQEMDGGAVFMGEIVSIDFYRKWMSLHKNICVKGIQVVVEEAAYTWFNRMVAIHIMSKLGFIAPVLNILKDESVPFIVREARQGRMPVMNSESLQKLNGILDDDSRTAEQFGILIVAFCHSNPVINKCFGNISDYTELLLPQNILSSDGFIEMLNNTEYISEEDYSSAELIGWLYQFYISDRKDEVFAKKGRYNPNEIAPATQIFTPNWIVKYMVENTIGRIYIDNNPSNNIKEELKYLVDGISSESLKYSELGELKVADLACGSGHILNECFDLLFRLYVEEGYSSRQAIINIFQENITGVDLDTRAKQLSMFSLLMKACQKDNIFLNAKVLPRIYDMPRPIQENIPDDYKGKETEEFLNKAIPKYIMGCNNIVLKEISNAITLMNNAESLGSIMIFDISESTRNALLIRTQEYERSIAEGQIVEECIRVLMPYMNIILALTEKYSAICMNPPYMGSGHFDNALSHYVTTNYDRSKADLFAVFMDVAINRLQENGKYGMINMQSWMFLPSFEKLRKHLITSYHIDSLLHLGPHTFIELSGEIVQNVTFVISKSDAVDNDGIYYDLTKSVDCNAKRDDFLCGKIKFEHVYQRNFPNIPLSPIAYWINTKEFNIIQNNKTIGDCSEPRAGLQTSDNDRFLRLWFEISSNKFGIDLDRSAALKSLKKWFPHNKGGEARKWYGNRCVVINFENDGEELKYWLEHNPNDPTTTSWSRNLRNYPLYFNKGITWSGVGDTISVRYSPVGSTFDTSGPMLFSDSNLLYLLGLSNSIVFANFLKIFSQGLSKGSGHFAKVPYIESSNICQIEKLVEENVNISKKDWNAHETSWDFTTNELLRVANGQSGAIEDFIKIYRTEWENNFDALHENEEEINNLFINTYGLQEELTPDVPLSDITILQAGEITHIKNENEYGSGHYQWNYDNIIKQLISYAVGCMMGRYSIDKPGLILANQGDGVDEYKQLIPDSRFEIDDDGIIPLMSSATEFTDAITLRFKNWLSTAFGANELVKNLNFIEGCLGKTLDEYFVKDFWNDHKKMYQSKPIYWLFSSKKGAFQCLAYMHRMNPYTAEKIRTKYLLSHIEWLVAKSQEMESRSSELNSTERKELDSLYKQIDECREYHDRLHVIADQQIAFDLDDGVTVNYARFGDILRKIK